MSWAAAIGAGASILGGLIGSKSDSDIAASNVKYQKQFAQEGIRWKVDDAKAAGIHPLYALGAQTHSFAPNQITGSPLGRGIADAGQQISRAATAASTQKQRTLAAAPLLALQVQKAGADIEYTRALTRRVNNPAQLPPPMPDGSPHYDNTTDVQRVKTTQSEIPATAQNAPSLQAGHIPYNQIIDAGDHLIMGPSKPFKDASEERMDLSIMHFWDETIMGKSARQMAKRIKFKFPMSTGMKRIGNKYYPLFGKKPFKSKFRSRQKSTRRTYKLAPARSSSRRSKWRKARQ